MILPHGNGSGGSLCIFLLCQKPYIARIEDRGQQEQTYTFGNKPNKMCGVWAIYIDKGQEPSCLLKFVSYVVSLVLIKQFLPSLIPSVTI
jgi:hypothetical protein